MIVEYVGRRLIQSAFVLWLAVTLAFVAMHLAPGDPAQALLAASGATPHEIAERRAALGLDDPFLVQYSRYLLDLIRGDLGKSWLHGRAVGQMMREQLASTATLAVAATTVGIVLGLSLGLLAALRRFTWLDTVATAVAVLGLSTPTYWSGYLAILLFSLQLGWLPSAGAGDLQHLILPAAVLGFGLSGSIARLVRARVIEVMGEPFVLAARARGLPPWRVILLHVLRSALAPALVVVALQFGFLLGGAVLTESVFTRRGLGKLAVEAVIWRDLPVVRGVVVLGALAYVLVNLAADLAQAWLDPRLREEVL
ncbi:MAG: ABC transporter permease [Chloroflexi bacterium]|nr:ABC transporter permease [Chloroflexota bacterium]